MSLSGTEAHAMKTVDDYEASLLFQLDFNQNDFVERVTKRSYSPSSLTGSFNEGIRYNSYAFSANKLIVPLTDVKADVENELTFSLWWYPELLSGNERILSVDDFGLQYNSTAKAFELVDGSNQVIQRFSQNMTSSKWAHLTISLNRQDIQKNTLAINGTNAPLTVITSGITPTWSQNSQLILSGSKSGNNGMTNGSRLDEVEIRKGIFTGTDATDVSRLAFVPDLNGEVINGNPHLSWSNDIMPEDVIIETSLEDGQMIPGLGANPGGQEIVSTGSYSGSKSIKVTDTYTNGNHINYPATSSIKSIAWWQRLFVPSGTDLSVTYYAKAEQANAVIAQNGDGGWATNFSSIPVIKLTQPVSKGAKELFVDNVASYSTGTHITFDEDPNVIGTYYTIESVNTTTKTIKILSGVNTAYPAGKEIRNRPWRGAFSFGSRTVTALPEWQRISQNTKVNNFADYDVLVRGASFYTNFTTKGVVWMDNIKLGYATKVKLFRGNTLLYEGLLSDYRDTASKDVVAPSSINVKKVNRTREKVEVSFAPAVDTGSTYGYRVQSVSNDGKGTPLSKEVEVEVVSGIKGYSYVLDNSPSTVPNNTVNTTATSVSLVANDSNHRYLHVKAIDNAGNAGTTKHIKIPVPELQVQADATGTFASMNWSMELASEDYDYKVYKRKKGEVDFQSISTFGQENDTQLRVLNVYPNVPATTTFTDWKGNTKTIPLSASIEKWMEEPNPEHPKGYGKGSIDVDTVPITSFNANPDLYLKNSDGSWKYNVVFEGAWDGNGFRAEDDYSLKAVDALKEWIDDGQGYLAGHDTIMYSSVWNTNTNLLRDRLNIKVRTLDAEAMGVGSTGAFTGNIVVQLDKQGLLTSYPWNIGELGSKLTVPASHNSSQVTYGDVWLSYEQSSGTMTDVNGEGKANFYLSTWNNTAMIQTGHSNGQATPDEQKVLANTLFYLSQKTTETELTDYSSIDDSKANTVPSLSYKKVASGVYDISFPTVQDNGTTYEYYVEAIGKGTGSIYQSAIEETTVKSGVKGYRVDVTTDSKVPVSVQVQSKTSPIRVTVPNTSLAEEPEFFIHVKAIDGAENTSVFTKRLDSATSFLVITPSEPDWTNKPVVLSIKGSEALGQIEEIYLPDGTVIKSPTASYTVSENGNYPFMARDEFGQWIAGGFTVINIDNGMPEIDMPNLPSTWTNKDIEVKINAK
jgi:hypothetical protein